MVRTTNVSINRPAPMMNPVCTIVVTLPNSRPNIEAAKMMPPKPAPEMAQLKLMQGSWKCSGKMEASPFGPAHAMQTTVTSKPDLEIVVGTVIAVARHQNEFAPGHSTRHMRGKHSGFGAGITKAHLLDRSHPIA